MNRDPILRWHELPLDLPIEDSSLEQPAPVAHNEREFPSADPPGQNAMSEGVEAITASETRDQLGLGPKVD
ncbi:MAG TPA: hypothetical protein VMT23_01325 [Candidatus Binatia bacterium]|nr:hypothetical protein [Candidatus Binatia bacterium]